MKSYRITTDCSEFYINTEEHYIDRLLSNMQGAGMSNVYIVTGEHFSIQLKSGSVKQITFLNETGDYPQVMVTNVLNKEREYTYGWKGEQ